jgi:hypothetical protein
MINVTNYTLRYKPYPFDSSLLSLQIIKIVYCFLTNLYTPLINISNCATYNHSGRYKFLNQKGE